MSQRAMWTAVLPPSPERKSGGGRLVWCYGREAEDQKRLLHGLAGRVGKCVDRALVYEVRCDLRDEDVGPRGTGLLPYK